MSGELVYTPLRHTALLAVADQQILLHQFAHPSERRVEAVTSAVSAEYEAAVLDLWHAQLIGVPRGAKPFGATPLVCTERGAQRLRTWSTTSKSA